MEIYTLLYKDSDGERSITGQVSTNKFTIEKELRNILSERANCPYIAFCKFDVGDEICDFTNDYTILEHYEGSYGTWKKLKTI